MCASVSVEVCDMLWLFRQLVHLKFCGMAQLCGGHVKQFVNCILARLSAFCLHLSVATEHYAKQPDTVYMPVAWQA